MNPELRRDFIVAPDFPPIAPSAEPDPLPAARSIVPSVPEVPAAKADVADPDPPTASIVAPRSGDMLNGVSTIEVKAGSNVALADLVLDGSSVLTFSGDSGTYEWDTASAKDGPHTLFVRAQDSSGNTTISRRINVVVNNNDRDPPSVAITYPAAGTTAQRGRSVTVTADASDDVAVARVEFFVNGELLCVVSAPPYSCPWTPSTRAAKQYAIQAIAYDAIGNSEAAAVTVFPSRPRWGDTNLAAVGR